MACRRRSSASSGPERSAALHGTIPSVIGSGIGVLAVAEGASWVDRWRGMAPTLWLLAAAGAVAWLALLGVLAFATRSRDVDAGPSTLELGGAEPPAVVNLLTNDWRLGREAVPATLLDLAARGFFGIEQVGEETLVRLRPGPERGQERAAALQPYERMVLDHVTQLAAGGVIPAQALTTGPEEQAKGWWKSFRRAVERDARRRGLSRRRWSRGARVILTLGAVAVGVLVAVAATTLPDNPKDSDDDPVGAAVGFGFLTAGALTAAVKATDGERDTAAGREAASRWLGLRAFLAEDPLFAEYPPAGVAIWDRLLGYGATMGVAHGAVRELPLGAESDHEAWSPVGGRWRVVRIRYPWRFPPGYGRHPARVLLGGLVWLGVAALAFPAVARGPAVVRDLVRGFSTDRALPSGFDLGVTVAVGVVLLVAAAVTVHGVLMTGAGVADLVRGRRLVEGRVLRLRRRGTDDEPRWYVAVDEGTERRIRAWRTDPGAVAQGCRVRARVTRWLAHVRDLEVVAHAPALPSLPADDAADDGAPLAGLLGVANGQGLAVPAPSGPPPPLPDSATVSAAAGRSLELDTTATPHPLAARQASATFTAADGSMVQVAWVDASLLQAHRAMPRLLRRELSGVGDEAYRALIGGGVVARRGGHVLMVMGRLAETADGERNRALEAVAKAAMGPPEAVTGRST